MAPCTFCGEPIEKGTGVMFVKKDAKIFTFCSRKCEKNMIQLKRKPRNITWTAEHRAAKAQAMAAEKKPTKKQKKAKAAPAKTAVKTPTTKKSPAKAAKKSVAKQ